jgi:predicted dienelactone hydrolase
VVSKPPFDYQDPSGLNVRKVFAFNPAQPYGFAQGGCETWQIPAQVASAGASVSRPISCASACARKHVIPARA